MGETPPTTREAGSKVIASTVLTEEAVIIIIIIEADRHAVTRHAVKVTTHMITAAADVEEEAEIVVKMMTLTIGGGNDIFML